VHTGGNTVEIIKIKTEADSNDMTAYSHEDKPNTGMFAFLYVYMYLSLHGIICVCIAYHL